MKNGIDKIIKMKELVVAVSSSLATAAVLTLMVLAGAALVQRIGSKK